MSAQISLAGRTFGRLIAISTKGKFSLCLCKCGTRKLIRNCHLSGGKTKSCGCLSRETTSRIFKTHGLSGSRAYGRWNTMIQRCTNPNVISFKNYGGNGVKVCKRWRTFELFLKDMGEPPKGLTIDRWPNKSGNYEPGNCRWATPKQQSRNTKRTKIYTVNGQTACLKDLCSIFGKKYKRIQDRIHKLGWSVENAFSKPFRG